MLLTIIPTDKVCPAVGTLSALTLVQTRSGN
jgi:hypothetical protein